MIPSPLSMPPSQRITLVVMEFWTGWFDHWDKLYLEHNLQPPELSETIKAIKEEEHSLNPWIFHGEMNFGGEFFMGHRLCFEGKKYWPTWCAHVWCVVCACGFLL